jgi:hypothetical protein
MMDWSSLPMKAWWLWPFSTAWASGDSSGKLLDPILCTLVPILFVFCLYNKMLKTPQLWRKQIYVAHNTEVWKSKIG